MGIAMLDISLPESAFTDPRLISAKQEVDLVGQRAPFDGTCMVLHPDRGRVVLTYGREGAMDQHVCAAKSVLKSLQAPSMTMLGGR